MECYIPPNTLLSIAAGPDLEHSKSARFRSGRSLRQRLMLYSCPVDVMSLPDAEPVRIETAGKTGLSGLIEEEALQGVLDLLPRGLYGEALCVAVDISTQVDLLGLPRLDVEADCCHIRAGIREDDFAIAAADGADLVGVNLHDGGGCHSAVDDLFLNGFHLCVLLYFDCQAGRRVLYLSYRPAVGGGGCLSMCFGRLLGKRPFSCYREAAGCCFGQILLVQVGVIGLKCLAIEAAGVDQLPGDLPVVPGQLVNLSRGHLILDAVGDGLDLSGQLVSHAAQLSQLFDLGIHFVSAHCVISFQF